VTVKDRSYSWLANSIGSGFKTDPHNNMGPWAPNYNQSKVVTRVATRTGVNQPDWRRKIANHENATTSMSATYDMVFYRFGNVSMDFEYGPDPTTKTHQQISGALAVINGQDNRSLKAPIKDITSTDNSARAKFFKKL
jgi:hypothetical protein